LAGRVVIVTGAAAGIGLGCALAYAAQGARVIVADIDAVAGNAAVEEIGRAGGETWFRALDVADSRACTALVAETVSRLGALHVMHANAGIELCRSVWETEDAEWERVLAVNLSGSFWCARAAMRVMRDAGQGGVVTLTASPHAFMTSREIAAYAASKGGQVALMRALALEGAPFGIRVNALLPGAIETPMLHREAAASADPAALLRIFASAQPMGRLGQPADVGGVAVFLASDAAAFVTGSCYAADGGLMAAINSGPAISYTGTTA
jgi:NAD(P)-dependent dehydrogenase (short-subunit alcohol dehydrogenase family)